ncbi:MAG TPA: response regulator [Candidatus Angelobacter sp.]|nr:response regulator [Candidatus Angelobacter sp.]
MKPIPRLPHALTRGISVALAIFTAIALYSFWYEADRSRQSQLQLMRIDAEINLVNGLEWEAGRDKKITLREQHDIDSSLQSIQRMFSELAPSVRESPEIAHIHDLSLKYIDGITRVVSLMSAGHADEARAVDETEVDPTLEKIRAELLKANMLRGTHAETASRIQITGSLGVLLISSCFVLILLQREQKLRVSQLAAEASSRIKGEFLANMSHEIRTPINGILGMTELLMGTELTAEQREYALILMSSGDSLLGVINDILDFSKIEAGKLSLDPVPFDLHQTAEDVMRAFAVKAHQKHLEIMLEIGHGVPEYVTGDAARLRQILVNLIGNAIKFTSQGEILVAVRRNACTERECEIQFSVSDTGIGIAPEKYSLIFEAFAQADGATTRKYGGTGLGLAISAQLAGLMGGRIWVASEIGKGSSFSFTVRFGVAAAPQVIVARLDEELLNLPVLIVDDNTTNRRILVEMTQDWGMNASAAESGPEALRLLNIARQDGIPVRLALIDGHMPGMDGFELAERIKLDPRLAGATIMMLTSSEHQDDAARCSKLGISAYLVKPVRKSELLKAILTVLGRPSVPSPELVTRSVLRETRSCLRILVAEDNPINQTLVVRLLQKMGHIPTAVITGREALEALKRESFDVVLMDVQMPEMDGLSATKEIRKAERATGNHLPIIALTANAMKRDEDACLDAGMDSYLSKPVSSRKLAAALANIFAGQGHYDQQSMTTPAPVV